ncbi:DUF7139 domain-containing protein [Natrarchaeobius chitinivorans]|uniref:Uncharacterized protein n=1 Tax=Natrarchaeobius chitinivorans TaxID=1679083 RepID=A0A3N6M755_NATCH|nr:hypothetical protein [Natrarchaeobius chitinivorans]RQG91960.1 hypothetical protein EA473_18175 [Natrarchaeobius chitinivorans]
MTSLTDVYEGDARGVTSPRRLYAGTALVLVGAVLAAVAVLFAATDLFGWFVGSLAWEMGETYASVRIAGLLAGLGVPVALVGVFIVLPASRRVKAAAAISATLCVFGVALFWHAYPYHWNGVGDDLTFQVSVVYLLGLFTAVWCLFTAVVNFKTRNDPGGMLEMNVTRRNQTIVEVPEDEQSSSGFGGIGFFGATPDGEVETQTNAETDPDANAETEADDGTILSFGESERTARSQGSPTTGGPATAGTPTSDGGSATADLSSPLDGGDDAEIVEPATQPDPDQVTDRYCGNCRHFEYVRSSSGMVPYCARHERAMDDMDACEEWVPNSR